MLPRNPEAAKLIAMLGNIGFLERPFHPTTLVSVVHTNLLGCRRLNEELESRVQERPGELAAGNSQLLSQIEERERMEMTLRHMHRLEASSPAAVCSSNRGTAVHIYPPRAEAKTRVPDAVAHRCVRPKNSAPASCWSMTTMRYVR